MKRSLLLSFLALGLLFVLPACDVVVVSSGGDDDDSSGGDDDDSSVGDDDDSSVGDDDDTSGGDDDDTSGGDDDDTSGGDDDDTSGGDDDDTSGGDDDDTSGPSCGDLSCAADENCWNCAADCGTCNCPTEAEVVFYTASAWNLLADALVADPCSCADYYISLPAPPGPNPAEKFYPRANGQPEGIRARGPRLHALAEFHWQSWKNVSMPWYDMGVEFRTRMDAAGYDVDAGDTWAINELPSGVRHNLTVRDNVRELVRGLYDGPPGSTPSPGAVFTIAMGHGTQNFGVYRGYLKDWLQDQGFWQDADQYVRFWAQETYTDPSYTCVPGSTTGLRSNYINEYIQHFAHFAEVGPSSTSTSEAYLDLAYTPLMNAVWMSGTGFGNTQITLDAMKHHVSGQVYAARAWMNNHPYPDGRLGFAWARGAGVSTTDLTELAERLARSIRYAYGEGGGSASHACSSTGAYTWCQCSVAGAVFNQGWSTFDNW